MQVWCMLVQVGAEAAWFSLVQVQVSAVLRRLAQTGAVWCRLVQIGAV